jgi:RNA polymerase sigma-70 factor (ECF subfamily)
MEDARVPMSNLIAGRVEPEEERLVAMAKGGDQQAYARLLARHQTIAFRAAYLVAGSAAEAEDATQEACIKAWRSSASAPGHRFAPGWFRSRSTRPATGAAQRAGGPALPCA